MTNERANLYLSKAQEAEDAGKKAGNSQMRDLWLEIANSYRLLAVLAAKLRTVRSLKASKAPSPHTTA